MEGGARLPCPLGRGQHGTQAPKAQPTLEDVAESWILAGWDCNHGSSSSFCIATWLGDPKKIDKKDQKINRKAIRNSNNYVSLVADQVC